MMHNERLTKGDPAIGGWATLGLTVSSPLLTWGATIGENTGTDFAVGPYHFNPTLEIAVGVAAAAVFLVSLVGGFLRSSRASVPISIASVACLAAAGALCAIAWRTMTTGVIGANIGAGLVAFVVPFAVAGLLAAAVLVQHNFRRIGRARLASLLVSAVAVGPGMLLLLLQVVA